MRAEDWPNAKAAAGSNNRTTLDSSPAAALKLSGKGATLDASSATGKRWPCGATWTSNRLLAQ